MLNPSLLQECRNVLKNEAAKYTIDVPTKLARNIYQIFKSDKDKINPMETSGIYENECSKDNKTRCYTGLTKKEKLKKE